MKSLQLTNKSKENCGRDDTKEKTVYENENSDKRK